MKDKFNELRKWVQDAYGNISTKVGTAYDAVKSKFHRKQEIKDYVQANNTDCCSIRDRLKEEKELQAEIASHAVCLYASLLKWIDAKEELLKISNKIQFDGSSYDSSKAFLKASVAEFAAYYQAKNEVRRAEAGVTERQRRKLKKSKQDNRNGRVRQLLQLHGTGQA